MQANHAEDAVEGAPSEKGNRLWHCNEVNCSQDYLANPVFVAAVRQGRVVARSVTCPCVTVLLRTKLEREQIGKIAVFQNNDGQTAFFCQTHASVSSDRGLDKTVLPSERGLLAKFWLYLDAGLRRYRGISSENLHLYVEEQVFRFYYRGRYIYPVLAKALCDFVLEGKTSNSDSRQSG